MEKQLYFIIIASLILTGLIFQLSVPLNHDIAWILHGAKLMTEGAEYGKDIIEPNPPLIWFLSIPVIYFSEAFNLSLSTAFRLIMTLMGTASIIISYAMLKNTTLANQKNFIEIIIFLMTLFLFPLAWRDFGQREYLTLLAILPFSFLILARLDGFKPKTIQSFFIGFVAGVGLALKPYLMIIPLCFGIYGLLKVRLQVFTWGEFYGVAISIITYLLSIFILTPAYINDVIPIVMKFYWGFNNSLLSIIYAYYGLFISPIIWGILMAVNKIKLSNFQIILSFLLGGFLFSLLFQAKGYTYHAYPALVTLTILLVTTLFIPHSKTQAKWLKPRITEIIFISLFASSFFSGASKALTWTLHATNTNLHLQKTQREINNEINQLTPNGTFTAFSTHPFPGFPTALMVNARWVGRSNSHMAIPAIVKSMEQNIEVDATVENFARAEALKTIQEFNPQVVIVDQRPFRHAIFEHHFDFLDYYNQDLEFRRAWSKYQKVNSINGIDFYKRPSTHINELK